MRLTVPSLIFGSLALPILVVYNGRTPSHLFGSGGLVWLAFLRWLPGSIALNVVPAMPESAVVS
jgi:hypothetical protein